MIYFDNNATTPPAPAALEAMQECLLECWGNPSSPHAVGAAARTRLNQARAQVAALINATAAEIIFTASATEANQMALRSALGRPDGRRAIVASRVEHAASLLLLRQLEEQGVPVRWVGVDGQGRLDLDQLDAAIGADTALVTLMWANNETGVLFPVAEAAALAHARGALLHTDAVQAAGRVALDIAATVPDFLTLAGHKLHAPRGAAALFVRKGVRVAPLMPGHQERGRRGGTENVAAIAALGVAAEQAGRRLAQTAPALAALRGRFEQGVRARVAQAVVHGEKALRLPNTSSLRIGTTDAEFVLNRLERAGICASSGSACTAGGTAPSHVLRAMGMPEAEALATVRFSFSRYNRADEVDAAIDVLAANFGS